MFLIDVGNLMVEDHIETSDRSHTLCQLVIASIEENAMWKPMLDGSDVDTSVEKQDMRYFIYYPPKQAIRLIDVTDQVLVEDVLNLVKQEFGLNIEDSGPAETSIVLSYNGSDLKPTWSLTDLGIPSGAIIRCLYREIQAADLYVHCGFNKQILKLFDSTITLETSLGTIRKKISDKLGLPLSTFCLEAHEGQVRLYDQQRLMDYDLKIHDHIYLKVWRGYEKLINACVKGFTEPYAHDDLTRHYQTQVALYIAAFYGHMELATSAMQQGARSDRPVGEHPSRQWSSDKTVEISPETLKCPIHVAIERGHVKMVDLFVRQSILCTQIRDPVSGFLPLRLALSRSLAAKNKEERQRYRVIYFFLHDKQYNLRIPLNGSGDLVSNLLTSTVSAGAIHRSSANLINVSLRFYCRIISWYERAREKAWKKYGGRFYNPSQTKRVFPKKGLLGYKVLIDGFNNTFDVPVEQTRGARHNVTPANDPDLRYVGFSEEEREKILQMKSFVKHAALDDRTRAKQIAAANLQHSRRPPMLTSQPSDTHSSTIPSSISQCPTNTSIPDLKLFQSNLQSFSHPPSAVKRSTQTSNHPQVNLPFDRTRLDTRKSKSSDLLSSTNHSEVEKSNLPRVIQTIQSGMSSVDAYNLSSSRRTFEIEQQKAIKRRELFAQIEQSVQTQAQPPVTRPTAPVPVELKPAMNLDAVIPLPEHPSNQRSRAMKSRLDYDIHQATVKPYERYASATSRKTAVNCLQEAGYFKGKSWLKQVEISKEMIRHRVKRRIRRADQPEDVNLTASAVPTNMPTIIHKPNIVKVN